MPRRKTAKPTDPKRKRLKQLLTLAAALIVLAVGSAFTVSFHLENNDAFCASCHTQPESAYYDRTKAAAAPADLASFHTTKQVTCIQCHSGPGTTGRAMAVTTVALPDLALYLSGNYHKPAIVTTPIGDGNCVKCHAQTTTRSDFNNHFHNFLSRWRAADPQGAATSVECHRSHATDGSATIAFLQEASTVAVCNRCHAVLGGGG